MSDGDLSDIVDLTITIEASGITRAGFGTVLIGGYHARTTGDRVSSYSKLGDMVDDGFVSTDLEYKAAAKVKGAETSPKTFKVARLGTLAEGPSQIMDIFATTGVSTRYALQVAISGGDWQDVDVTSSATATNAEILASLTAAIAALTGYAGNIVAATGSSSKVRISAASAGKYFDLRSLTSTFSNVTDETADPGVADDLNTVLAEDTDWYALVLTYKSQAIAASAAALIQTLRKVYIVATMDKEVTSAGVTDDLGSTLKASSYSRTIVLFNDDHMAQGDAALAGVWLPYSPGSETLKFKPLAGILPTSLTSAQKAAMRTKRVNFYTSYAGVGIVSEGMVSYRYFADLVRFTDWLYATIQEDVFAALVRNPKLPYTRAGFAALEGVIRSSLQKGVSAGGLDAGFILEMPDFADVDSTDRENRLVTPVTWSAQSAGAIHGVDINGSVNI